MNWVLKPLGHLRFSIKVGGGFAATTLLTAAVGLVGTLAIVQLRDQSNMNAKATAVMASLQEASADQNAYLTDRTPERAAAALEQIARLHDDLSTVHVGLAPSSPDKENVSAAISNVDGLTTEFKGLVAAAETQSSQARQLLASAGRLETVAKGIGEQMGRHRPRARGRSGRSPCESGPGIRCARCRGSTPRPG